MSDPRVMKVRPGHLLRALCGIENWIKGVRKVLVQMDPNLEIEIKQHHPSWDWAASGGNIPTVHGCPPPEIKDPGDPTNPPQVEGCPPPEWYQDDCPERT